MHDLLATPRSAVTPHPVDDAVFLLGLLYLELGLAPEDAFRAALADHRCQEEGSVGCPR